MEASKMIESISGEFSRSMLFVPRAVREECEELAKGLLESN
jgi:hypothetical protein